MVGTMRMEGRMGRMRMGRRIRGGGNEEDKGQVMLVGASVSYQDRPMSRSRAVRYQNALSPWQRAWVWQSRCCCMA